jgi:hypothetical protein
MKKSPPPTVRESIEIRPTGADPLPETMRPLTAVATSAAVSGTPATRYETFDPARLLASAPRATSTSSNGSVRAPITWYFS